MYDMPLRDYDPASAKWFNIDPVTHYDQSPFMAMNGNPVTFSDPSGADGHNWNPYSDMSMNNYGANGTSSPGRNSNGDNDGGSSIFWGSSRMLFEQSYEAHDPNRTITTSDPVAIRTFMDNVLTSQFNLPTITITKNSDLSGNLIQQHVYKNSPYYIGDLEKGWSTLNSRALSPLGTVAGIFEQGAKYGTSSRGLNTRLPGAAADLATDAKLLKVTGTVAKGIAVSQIALAAYQWNENKTWGNATRVGVQVTILGIEAAFNAYAPGSGIIIGIGLGILEAEYGNDLYNLIDGVK